MAGPLRVRGQVYYAGAQGLLDAVRDGGTAFERTYGAPFFDHLGRHPEQESAFQASMAGRSEQEAGAVVAAYDFTGLASLVDVGGGRGVLLAAILDAAPHIKATLVDRSGAVEAAREHVAATCIEGDFFDVASRRRRRLPALARPARLGRRGRAAHPRRLPCRDARAGRLLVVDAILPERAKDAAFAIRMDLHMLLLLGARERTEAEFRSLLGAAGFDIERVVPTRSPAGLSVIEAVRAP